MMSAMNFMADIFKHMTMKFIITASFIILIFNMGLSQEKKKNALNFIYDPSECQNCITEELNLSLKYYSMFPDQVFFIVENNAYKQKLQLLVSNLEFKVNPNNIEVDQIIYKKYVKHPLQVVRNGKFSEYKLNTGFSDLFELNLQVDRVEKSVTIPKRMEGFRYQLVSNDKDEIKIFYEEIGILVSNKDTINIVRKIDTVEVISALHLNQMDVQLTFDEIKNKKAVTQPLFQILAPVTSPEKGFLYFTTMVTYSHQLTKAEIIEIRKTSKRYNQMLKNAENEGVTVLKHELFISKFDLEYNYIESYIVGNPNNGYDKDYPSPFYKNENEVIGNLHWYTTDTIKKRPYPTYGHYLLNADSIHFENADVFRRPDFYEKKGFDNNCANTLFSTVDSSVIYHYAAYPCAIDVTNHIRYEIPIKDIEAICKLEKQKFNSKLWLKYYTLGLIHLENGANVLLFRAYLSEQIYYGIFNDEGDYFGFGKMEQNLPMKATTTLNGELINILENEIQYLLIDIKE